MKNLKKHLKAVLVSLFVLSAAGVGYFDTYPTYITKEPVLSQAECYQVATLVAVQAFKRQNPDQAVPAGVMEGLKTVTRKAKRVANWIVEKNQDNGFMDRPPAYIQSFLTDACLSVGGKANLKTE